MASKKRPEVKELSLSQERIITAEIEEAFDCFIDFKQLNKAKRKPKVVKKALLYLRKDLKANVRNSGIENLGTDWMLEGIGRGMIRYSRRWAWLMRQYQFAARVPVPKDKRRARIIDLGADVGEIRRIMSSSFYYPNPLYVGVDINHENLEEGFYAIRSRTPALLVQHDVTYPLKWVKSRRVDCVFAGEIIEHFDKKYGVKMLKDIYRMLKKRGKIFISTPCKKNSKEYKFHRYEYEPDELKKILKDIGFRIIRSYGWVSTEKVLFSRMTEEDRKFYERLTRKVHKDIAVPVFCHLDPNYADAFCIEGVKK